MITALDTILISFPFIIFHDMCFSDAFMNTTPRGRPTPELNTLIGLTFRCSSHKSRQVIISVFDEIKKVKSVLGIINRKMKYS